MTTTATRTTPLHLIDLFSSFMFFTAYRGRKQRTMVAEKKSRTPLSIMACVESGCKGSSFIERGILEAPGLDVQFDMLEHMTSPSSIEKANMGENSSRYGVKIQTSQSDRECGFLKEFSIFSMHKKKQKLVINEKFQFFFSRFVYFLLIEILQKNQIQKLYKNKNNFIA